MRAANHSRLLLVLVAVCALILAACGDDSGDDDASTEDTSDTSTTTETSAPTDDEGTDQEATFELTAGLEALNDSGASGEATVTSTSPGTIDVTVETEGVSPGVPHAQHLHIGGEFTCPEPEAAGDDDVITTAEGAPAYGEVRVALTVEGDVSADSALAVERFPVAEEDGTISYQRTFDLPGDVTAADVLEAVVVQHGDASRSGDEAAYDGEEESSLDPSLPLEATIPVLCAPLTPS